MTESLFRIAVIVMLFAAAYNAKEAHRHTHELACHLQADDLCRYHGVTP